MGFPTVHYGNYGDEKVSSSTKINGLPLGIKMAFPDGREFRHARAGGTVLVAGKLYESATSIVGSDTMYSKSLVLSSTVAVGATAVAFTAGVTTGVTTNLFADGYLNTSGSIGTGIGYTYAIKTNNSAAAGSACTLSLYETDSIVTALAGATTLVGVRENPYNLVKLTTADTVMTGKMGVACNSAAASSYVWLQTKGPGPLFTGGTVLINGESVVPSTAVAGAGAVLVASTAGFTSAKAGQVIGVCLQGAVTAGFALVDLNIP